MEKAAFRIKPEIESPFHFSLRAASLIQAEPRTGLMMGRLVVLLLLCLAAISEAQKLEIFERQYKDFDRSYYDIFQFEQNATINNNALQVTIDSAYPDFRLDNASGRVMLKQSFKLWEGDLSSNSSRVASLNTSFLININQPRNNATTGEGLTFLIAPDLGIPSNSFGQYLGLTNSSTDGVATNQVVAVELDTFKQDFDPDANHIGLNIHGVRSVMNASLSPLGIELGTKDARFYNVWIQYDGVKKDIEVYIAEQSEQNGPTPPRPSDPVLKSDLELRGIVAQYSYLGFSASTGTAIELNCVLRWNLTVEYFSKDEHKWVAVVLGAGVPVLVLLLLGAAGLGYYLHKRRQNRSNPQILGALRSLPGTPREFEFKDLKKATSNFDEKNKLGQGGYGVVYRGMYHSENLDIAVKWFSRESLKGQDDFLAELTVINRLRHRHLVRLLGWCHKNGKLLLVYEYMPNGSLDKHLFTGADGSLLGWSLRYKIISGVASALHYLHIEYDQRVVHRDLKASNIMLDANFNARLGDFGLARALDNEKTSYAEAEGVLGTMGYIAPECFHTGKATALSDIYAFGAVVLETVCGQRPGAKVGGFQFLVDWVWSLYREDRVLDAVEQRLERDFVVEEAERLLLLGLACSHPIASERPKTQEIIQIVSGTVAVPKVPPFKPAFIWPAIMPLDEITTSADTSSFSGISPQYLSRESYTGYTDQSLA